MKKRSGRFNYFFPGFRHRNGKVRPLRASSQRNPEKALRCSGHNNAIVIGQYLMYTPRRCPNHRRLQFENYRQQTH